MVASASGSVDSVKILLDAGAEIEAKEKVHGQTALMFAAALNRVDVVKFLLSRHADPNAATLIKKMEHVRYDMDGNVVEEGGAAKTKPRSRPRGSRRRAECARQIHRI